MEFNFGDTAKPDPCLVVAQLVHKVTKGLVRGDARSKMVKEIKDIIFNHNMVVYYDYIKSQIKELKYSNDEIAAMNTNIENGLKEIEKELTDSLGDIEELQAMIKKSVLLHCSKPKEEALAYYNEIDNLKSVSTGQKIDNNLSKIRLGLFWKDFDIIETSIETCENFLENGGGDWERRNKLKVFRSIFLILQRKFIESSKDLIQTISTFTSTELCTYEMYIRYCIVVSIISLSRVEFKEKIIDSIEVKTVFKKFEWLPEFVLTLYEADYATFMKSITKIYPFIEADRYLSDHAKWWVRELRIKTYAQFLQPYKSVTLDMMSYEFGVSKQFLDRELSRFIADGKIQAKINKTSGVIETVNQTATNLKYQQVIKSGDMLLNKIQNLSRLLGV